MSQEATLTQQSRVAVRKEAAGQFSRLQSAALRAAGTVVFVLAWEGAVRSGIVDRLFLAPPSAIAETIWELAGAGTLWTHILETLRATLIGFAAGTLVGVLLGFALGLMPRIGALLSPFVTTMNSMPRIALAPLFVLWFGIGLTSRVVLVFSLVVFIVLTNTMAGTQSVDGDFLRLSRLLNAKRRDIILKVVLPSTVPWIFAAMRLSFAYALAGAVVGEMFLGQRGLGYLIVAGSGVFNISQIFAALVITVCIAYVLDSAAGLLERNLLKWRPKELAR
ncbi:MAG: ABC transporter permease subunit [Micromonosporaceae bacterium]|nr:ABC transporter permease subunit [Micromonosporaceae bacterium]